MRLTPEVVTSNVGGANPTYTYDSLGAVFAIFNGRNVMVGKRQDVALEQILSNPTYRYLVGESSGYGR